MHKDIFLTDLEYHIMDCNHCAEGFTTKAYVADHAKKTHFDTTNLNAT